LTTLVTADAASVTSVDLPLDVLAGVRVVELATGIAGPYAGKLFADAGADVVKIEPAEGDPERWRVPGGVAVSERGSALFQHLNVSKRLLNGGPGDTGVDQLLETADIVIESLVPEQIDVADLQARAPAVVVLSITPLGRRGPDCGRPANGFTIQAESGSIGSRGRRDQVPFQAGGRIAEWVAGVCGAVGAMAAWIGARHSGIGEHVDCCLLAVDHLITSGAVSLRDSLAGHPPSDQPARMVDVPSVERTLDGFIGLNLNTRQHVENFLSLIGRDDLNDDGRWVSASFRFDNYVEWNDMVRPWLESRTTDEIMELAAAARLPTATVNNGATVTQQEQFVARRAIGPHPEAAFLHPKPPYRINGIRPAVRSAPTAPSLIARPQRAGPDGQSPSRLPFQGLRVLDATAMWAGPTVGQVFGALGADVIHLESIQRLDLARLKSDAGPDVPDWWERAHNWLMLGWNKRDLTLDLSGAAGHEIVAALIRSCDVMVENFSPRVFERFGLDGSAVLSINPEIVYARMPAFGLDGPWRDYIGFAQTMEQMSGLAWVTGHVDGPPVVPRGPCDPLAGYHALFAIMVALEARRGGGGGSIVEAAMAESALNAAAESVVNFAAYGIVLEREGNRSCDAEPQAVYPCRGPEQWVAVSVENDEQWCALVDVVGRPEWSDSETLRSREGRRAQHDMIDEHLSTWTAGLPAADVATMLRARGIAAAVVTDPRLADQHPHLRACGYFEPIEHPIVGVHLTPTLPFRFASVDRWSRTAAPRLGQHNCDILRDLLNLDDVAIDELATLGVIGAEPLGTNPSFSM
jgi:crotonobetainyl-CoA:carnitine CoA-transferase CaiB-like acyl-CoA transferase